MSANVHRMWFIAASTIQKAVTPVIVSGAALIAVACVDEPAAPAGAGRQMPNIAQAGSGELILSTGGSVWRSAAASDSTGDLLLARATVQGVSGDSIAVRLVSEDLVESDSPGLEPELLAVVEGRFIAITQAALRKGQRIFRFSDDRSVQVEYRLKRQRGVVLRSENIRLVQTTSGRVNSAETPWVFGAPDVAAVAAARGGGPGGTTCPLNAATGACDAVQWNIVPFAAGFVFPGFQSDPVSTGPSHEISITFSSSVTSITVTVNDPTWVGNKMIAYEGSQVVDTAAFVGSGLPGFNNPSTRTISGSFTRVALIPATNDYVTYEVSIVVDGNVRLNVSCFPAPVVRAAAVTCTASLSNNKAFSVIWATVDGLDGSPVPVSFTSVNGGKAWQTQGPGLYPTTLSVTALSGTTFYGGTGYVTISPRTFPSMSFPAFPTERKATPKDGFVYLDFAVGPFPKKWGEMRYPKLDTLAIGPIPVVAATSGPSVGYATVGQISSLPLEPPEVVLARTLYREGFFYTDQNGHDGTSDRENGVLYCNNATDPGWVDRLLAFVRRHEGVTGAPNSHYGLWTQAFQTMNPQGAIEALVFPGSTPADQVKGRVIGAFTGWLSQKSVNVAHDELENLESTNAKFNAEAGCALDRDLTKERGS